MNNNRENIELVFIIQLFMILLKIFDSIALPWSIILIPVEALIALPILTIFLYLLGFLFRVFVGILKNINAEIQKFINNMSIKDDERRTN